MLLCYKIPRNAGDTIAAYTNIAMDLKSMKEILHILFCKVIF